MIDPPRIDLNADLGEEPDAAARDIALMRLVTRCSIACGGHAGDIDSMRTMLLAADAAGIVAGAHPSYPDRAHFGRQTMLIGDHELIDSLCAQIDLIAETARAHGITLAHVKPHGALYNDLADQEERAGIVAAALHRAFPDLAVIGLAGGAYAAAAAACGQRFIAEGFIDRAYDARGRLVPRDRPGAVLADDAARVAQALAIAAEHRVTTIEGAALPLAAETLCIHSDSPGALATAQAVRTALAAAGITVAADGPR